MFILKLCDVTAGVASPLIFITVLTSFHKFSNRKKIGYDLNNLIIKIYYQGKTEFKLPMAYWSLPRWFRGRFPAAARNLRRNARRLTTPFDLHATLRDLTDPAAHLEPHTLRMRTKCLQFKTGYKGILSRSILIICALP